MKKRQRILSLLVAALLCVCLAVPAPAAKAEQSGVTIYSMLMFLIQGYQVQPVAAYDVTDMFTGSNVLDTSETVIGFLMEQNWLLLSGLNSAGVYTATIYTYEDSSFFVLLRAIAGTYTSLQESTSREGEKLVIEVALEEGRSYVFDSPEDAQALLDLLSE